MMFRILSLIACLSVPTSVLAQDVLLAAPPTYEHDERSTGVMTGLNGAQFPMHQRAVRTANGETNIAVDLKDYRGDTFGRMVFNPHTWRAWSEGPGEKIKVVESTCTAERLFPITPGKVYECASVLEVNGHRIDHAMKVTFDKAPPRDQKGRILRLCSIYEDNDGRAKIRARSCASPDGKWMRSVDILEAIPLQKT